MPKRGIAIALAVCALSVGACGGGSKKNGAVTVKDIAFNPGSVSVKAGDSVTWSFKDSVYHTVTATDGSFDSGKKDEGTFKHTFPKAGTFTYHCTIHSTMTGTVTVS